MRLLPLSSMMLVVLMGTGSLQGQFSQDDMAQDLEEASSFQKYPSYDQYLGIMQDLAAGYPGICRLDTFGTSQEGRLLLALKISDHVHESEAEASFLYSSTMHGDEILGYVLMLRLADHLLEQYGTDPQVTSLVDSLEIYINPLANPDGAYKGGNHSLAGADRYVSSGHDLNRTFPDITAGEADDTTGRPPENRHMMRFLRQHRFNLSANIHGGYEVVNYPWDWDTIVHPDDDWFRLIAREYVDEVHSVDPAYMLMEDDGITHGARWYIAPGTRQDYVTHYLGGREMTLELSFEKLLPSVQLEPHWEKNRASLLYYMAQATYGIHGRVRSGVDNTPLKARIEVIGHDDSTSTVSSDSVHGDFHRFLKGGSYDLLFNAEGFTPFLATGVQVEDFQSTWLDIRMEPGYKSTSPGLYTGTLSIFPNPASGHCRLVGDFRADEELRLSLYSSTGSLVLEKRMPGNPSGMILETDQLKSGSYVIRLHGDSLLYTGKLLIHR